MPSRPRRWRLRINGQKTWCSNGHIAEHILLVARTDATGGRHDGLTMFCIPAAPGHADPRHSHDGGSDVNDVFFTDCFLPDEAVVGKVDQAWTQLMSGLNSERLILGGNDAGRTSASSTTP